MIDLTDVIIAVIGLVGTMVTTFLVPYLKQKLTNEQYSEMQLWVNIAVKAAEMLYTGSGCGAAKKEYVIEFLKQKGYTMDTESIENMIESAVLEMQNCMKK